MSLVKSKRRYMVEAGELRVETANDCVNPSKLAMLAEEGWSIQSAWSLKGGGFNLLLSRPLKKDING